MIRSWSSPVAALAALGVAMVPTAAPDRTPPRIVSAVMVDLNGNARAERVRLTYSERVRHARDNDGKYSFVVVGYRVLAVGAATGRSLVLLVKERVSADSAARPVVRYTKTSSKPVLDGAGNQASAQAFRLTRAHGHAPPSQPKPTSAPAPAPAPTPPASSAPDSDKDGYDDAHDCAPSNAAIHPNAPDLPDLGFVDSNCDRIDGTEANAVFVSPRGNDANPGTKAQPKRQIQAAVLEAAKSGKGVFAAGGDYGAVDAQTGVAVYGGYDPTTWQRSLQLKTTITGAPQGFFLAGDKDVLLQLLTIVGTTGSGSNVYGIRALDSSELTLQRVATAAGPAPDGLPGAGGADGRGGYDGNEGRAGACDDDTGGQGATGGYSWGGQLGNGGTGGHGGNAFGDRGDGQPGYAGGGGVVGLIGGAGGVGGKTGNPGRLGGSGQPGLTGAQGRPGVGGTTPTAGIAWTGQAGAAGTRGDTGQGGGGGGGGGGQIGAFVEDGRGNGGGGGGGSGTGGEPGKGGGWGGGSFGVYLYYSKLTVTDSSSIKAGTGGAGGAGGSGGAGGPGGTGGAGGIYCTSEIGAGGRGGPGGAGGSGGGGGGGLGGPSIGVLKVGTSTLDVTGSTVAPGPEGPGGRGGSPGVNEGRPGISAAVYAM